MYIDTETDAPYFERMYYVRFDVEQTLIPLRPTANPDYLNVQFQYSETDGSCPFVPGKRYLVIGNYYGDWSNAQILESYMRLYISGYISMDSPRRRMTTNNNQMYMDIFPVRYELTYAGQVHAPDDFSASILRDINIIGYIELYGLLDDDFPLDIFARVPESGQVLPWFEIEGSLEEALSAERGELIQEALSAAELSTGGLTVITTKDSNSLFHFHQRKASIVEGRRFTKNEANSDEKLCLISRELAELNNLSVGDVLELQLYPSALNQIRLYYNAVSQTALNTLPQMGRDSVFEEADTWLGISHWHPEKYYPGLPVSGRLEYEIIGIYTSPQSYGDFTISSDTVIIPAGSFDGFTGYTPPERKYTFYDSDNKSYKLYDAPMLQTFIIPNGGMDEARAKIYEIAPEGRAGYFRFYDQGYSVLKPAFASIRSGTTFILAIAAAGWAVAVSLFCLLYIGRKRREAAILHALGLSKKKRFRWIYIQCAVIIVIAQVAALGAALPVYDTAVDAAVSMSRDDTERDVIFSDVGDSEGIEISIDKDQAALIAIAAAQVLILFTVVWFVSRRAAVFKALDKRGGW